MSGSNDPTLIAALAGIRSQNRRPSAQQRLAEQMMASLNNNTPVYGTGPTLARAGSGMMAGLMAALTDRQEREREDTQIQQATNMQEKRGIRQREELQAGPPEGVDRRLWLAELAGGGNNSANARLTIEREDFNRAENERIRREDREHAARLAAANRAPRAPEELITIDREGRPVLVPRSQAVNQTPWRAPERVAAPAGYRVTEGGGLEAIPGGPADPAVLERRVAANAAARPVPAYVQRQEDEDITAIGAAGGTTGLLRRYTAMIENELSGRGDASERLALGPVQNLASSARNTTGVSSPNSINYASFRADLERLRNESLRLNTGVQTEGDAQRIWNELITNINDPRVVARRLQEIQALNERAISLRQAMISQRRANSGLPDIDATRFALPNPDPTPQAPRQTVQPGAPAGSDAAPRAPGLVDRARARNGIPTITTEAEFNALPSGQRFISPDGSMRVKP
jgi:hypothetical protein